MLHPSSADPLFKLKMEMLIWIRFNLETELHQSVLLLLMVLFYLFQLLTERGRHAKDTLLQVRYQGSFFSEKKKTKGACKLTNDPRPCNEKEARQG